MKKILLLNGGKAFAHSAGQYNATLHRAAIETLMAAGFEVRTTEIDAGYDVQQEVEKDPLGRRADLSDARLVDGRTTDGEEIPGRGVHRRPRQSLRQRRPHPLRRLAEVRQRRSASGQTLHDLRHGMRRSRPSTTSDFFAGKGVDSVYLPFHKANRFLGMQGLPTFLCVDVMKRPQVEADVERYRRHRVRCSASASDLRQARKPLAAWPGGVFVSVRGDQSTALTMSSTTFLASPKTIMVLSM